MAGAVTKRAGGEKRGNSADRRARKNNLLRRHGDGVTCPCSYCGAPLDFDTIEADRIDAGGPYRLTNVIPAGRGCNLERSNMAFDAYVATKARNPQLAMAAAQLARTN